MDDIKYIYLQITNGIEETKDEKQVLFEEMLYFIFSYSSIFNTSNNLLELVSSVYNYYIDVLRDINREQDIYEGFRDYFREISNEDLIRLSEDEESMSELLKMLESLEQIVENRLLNHAKNYGYFKDLLDSPSLTNKFYKNIKFKSVITEEKKLSFLSLIPRG